MKSQGTEFKADFTLLRRNGQSGIIKKTWIYHLLGDRLHQNVEWGCQTRFH